MRARGPTIKVASTEPEAKLPIGGPWNKSPDICVPSCLSSIPLAKPEDMPHRVGAMVARIKAPSCFATSPRLSWEMAAGSMTGAASIKSCLGSPDLSMVRREARKGVLEDGFLLGVCNYGGLCVWNPCCWSLFFGTKLREIPATPPASRPPLSCLSAMVSISFPCPLLLARVLQEARV